MLNEENVVYKYIYTMEFYSVVRKNETIKPAR